MSSGRRVEIGDLYEYRFPSSPALSPDGGSLVYVVKQADASSNSYRSNLWLANLSDDSIRQLTTSDKDSAPYWLDEKRLIFTSKRAKFGDDASESSSPHTAYYSIHSDGGEAQYLFSIPRTVSWIRPLPDGRYLTLSTWEGDSLPELEPEQTRVHAFEEAPVWFNGIGFRHRARKRLGVFDPEDESIVDLTGEDLDLTSADLSPSGLRAVFAARRIQATTDVHERLFVTAVPDRETTPALPDEIGLRSDLRDPSIGSPVFVDEDTIGVLVVDFAEHGINATSALYTISASGGEASLQSYDPMIELGKSSVGTDVRIGASAAGLVSAGGAIYLAGSHRYRSDLYAVRDGALDRITSGDGALLAFDAVGTRESGIVTATVEMRGTELPELFVRDSRGERSLTALNTEYMQSRDIGVPEHRLVASNGDDLDSWVLLPSGAADSDVRIPAIVNVHGGPRTAYGELFFHEMQVWAARGFAVIFCNPHGSDARGNEFADIRGRYGSIDYEDILAVLDAALEACPQIDPNRVCLTGGSYGGFMTNWAIGHTDRFVAAASQRSISNWYAFWGTSDIGYYFADDQLAATPWGDPARYWEQSPLAYADRVKTPTLFIHSDADHRCWIQDALQMHTALCYHGVPSRLVWVEGENHELSRSGKPLPRVRRLEEITTWFEQHTGLLPSSNLQAQ